MLTGIKRLDIESDALPLHAPQCFTLYIFQSDQDLLYSMVKFDSLREPLITLCLLHIP